MKADELSPRKTLRDIGNKYDPAQRAYYKIKEQSNSLKNMINLWMKLEINIPSELHEISVLLDDFISDELDEAQTNDKKLKIAENNFRIITHDFLNLYESHYSNSV